MDSEAALKTCSSAMDAVGRKRGSDMEDAADTSEHLPVTRGRRCCVEEVLFAFVADQEVVKEHARRRGPEIKAHRDGAHAPTLDGADAAISA